VGHLGKETAHTLVPGHFLLRTAAALSIYYISTHANRLKVCAVPGLVVVGKDLATTKAVDGKRLPSFQSLPFDALAVGAKVAPSAALSGIQQCRVMASAAKHEWLLPYLDLIVFEVGSWSPPLYRSYLYWLIGPRSGIDFDSVQSPAVLPGPQATEITVVGRTLGRWCRSVPSLLRLRLLMLVFGQGLYILFSCFVNISIYLRGLVIEQTYHSP
jgi:hypothetical protein